MIIPTWNAGDVLGECLESLQRQRLPGGSETIVVDNASTDGTALLLRQQRDGVRVISNSENVGFSAACNQGAKKARGRALLFLNSDTELLAPDTLERLVCALDDPGVGVAGPILVNPDGTIQPSCGSHPSIGRALLVGSGAWRLLPQSLRARVTPELSAHAESMDVGWVMGAALAVPADLFRQVGGFWPTMYAEDEDLAYKVQRRGLRVRLESSARVLHVGNHSLGKRWSDAERAVRVANAELVFLRTHYGRPRRAAIRAIAGFGYAARALVHRLLGHRDRAAVFAAIARRYIPVPR